MLSFDEKEVVFTFKGKENKLRAPNNKDLRGYRKNLAKCEDDEQREDILINFLVELGGNKETIDLLRPDQTAQLLNALTGAEKN